VKLLVETSHAVPLASVSVFIRSGSITDPNGQEGLTRHAAELMRRGAGSRSRAELDAALDEIGASIDVMVGGDSVGFVGHGLSRHLDKVVDMLADVLARATMSDEEHEKLRRESQAMLDELRDDDAALAGRYFDRAAFAGHPYGRTTLGTAASLEALDVNRARAWRDAFLRRPELVVGFSGDVDEARAAVLAERLVAALPAEMTPIWSEADVPPPSGGRRTVLIDKPERTQTQIILGHVGPARRHPDWLALSVAGCVFGGTFTSRLMKEVRVERGWSYGASARLGRGRLGGALRMRVFPSVENTPGCLALCLELFEKLVSGGVTADEVEFALGYLRGSWAFELATAGDRLGKRLDLLLLDLPADTYSRHLERLAALSVDEINAAMRRHFHPESLTVAITGTAADVMPLIGGLPLGQVDVVGFESY
jgi:zinc protease